MPLEDPEVATTLEPGQPVTTLKIGDKPITQEFIDGLPTITDLRTSGSKPIAPPQATLYFIGKIVYDSLGPRQEVQFCSLLVRADAISRAVPLPKSPSDPNYLLSACPKWNTNKAKQAQ
jgi:hypothetical protein